ncbi:zinc dependent phospholipase C family protein [Clostridium sp. MSJ-4]|uniref:Zinc dependent phospholipase C family protein n=1 Tax=Clostridium simiarum TaxID=2841506 RepID=A0ABS6F363_9CLOT|nr:zinc dependent phospholipase C family protein [Clostridium simiarum]MBU5592825.1 zinc dependent phospholipase C family protein [Clostridium simiarum]
MEKNKFEFTYGKALHGIMFAVNPLKKLVLKTHCIVHKFINIQAIQILNNDGYVEAGDYYRDHIKPLNEGVTWADQDFKSSNHFYHVTKGKGLYGFSDALTEGKKYYKMAINYMEAGDTNKALFYLGAACHLVQDTTVPHHVNNKLLKKHRKFELWIISKLFSDYSFAVESGILRFDSIDDYIKSNSQVAYSAYSKFSSIEDKEERYFRISSLILKQAQVTTAGFLLDFYESYIK